MDMLSAKFAYEWWLGDGYLYDWVAAIVVIVIAQVVPTTTIKPVDRFYVANDPTLSYPPMPDTISSTTLYLLVALFPLVVFLAFAIYKQSFHDGHHAMLSTLESFALAISWKRWMNLVGVYRPCWLGVLAAGGDVADARRSYPSGHCAYTFATATVVTLYLLGKFRVFSKPGRGQFLLALLSLAPVVMATFVAVTRIYDHKHSPADVNAGCFIGLVSGLFGYLLNYPSMLDVSSHLPRVRTLSTFKFTAVVPEVPVSRDASIAIVPIGGSGSQGHLVGKGDTLPV